MSRPKYPTNPPPTLKPTPADVIAVMLGVRRLETLLGRPPTDFEVQIRIGAPRLAAMVPPHPDPPHRRLAGYSEERPMNRRQRFWPKKPESVRPPRKGRIATVAKLVERLTLERGSPPTNGEIARLLACRIEVIERARAFLESP
jgi:hypothetical protein